MKTTMIAVFSLSLLVSGDLFANPIATESLRLRQVPNSTHVQVTWAVMEGEGGIKPTVNEISRDGAVLTGSWHELDDFTANTGSGLTSQPATQFCDCDVAVGSHDYVIKAVTYYDGRENTRTVTFVVEENLTQPHDAGVPGPDTNPWEIPEPTEIQGLDCLTECKVVEDGGVVSTEAGDPAPDLASAVQKDAGPTFQKDASATGEKESEDESGCAITGTARLEGSFILLLALGFLALRRRRE